MPVTFATQLTAVATLALAILALVGRLIRIFLNCCVESPWHAGCELADWHPLHGVHLAGVRRACCPGEHVTGSGPLRAEPRGEYLTE
jgi:hypothetical protein